jgi:hypothetical protein
MLSATLSSGERPSQSTKDHDPHPTGPCSLSKEYHLQGLLRQVKGCLQEKATLRRLLLVIVFNLWSNGGLQQIQKQSGEDWQRGKWILNQLRQLRQDGLMDLFVELREENHRRIFEPVEDYETEAFLERYVMGETYNSMERGKRKLLEID